MVEPPSDPKYRDQNRLANVVLPDEAQYAAVMKGEAVEPEPINAKPRKPSAGAPAQNAPAWGTDAAPAQAPQQVGSVPWTQQPQAAAPVAMAYPALWENKALGVSSWKDVVKRGVVLSKPIYAAQLALYQAYMDLPAPALFTALNRDTWEIHCELVPFDAALAQTMSDRAVQVVQASDAQELLPRAAAERISVVCRGGKTSAGWHSPCAWQDRCWGGCR
ncbi:MAG: hypothetical protein Q7R40_15100 [Phaeospirillum sp.]|nr:hypothetical protein [Phaeospirillum sp.]